MSTWVHFGDLYALHDVAKDSSVARRRFQRMSAAWPRLMITAPADGPRVTEPVDGEWVDRGLLDLELDLQLGTNKHGRA